jgi:broad specificity phosphatase PhoE
MEQTLWIVRHGNREDFSNRDWAKSAERPYDPGLSEDGARQAQEAGLSLRDRPVHRIYASPYLRTIQTANHIADVVDLPVRLELGIGEILPNIQEAPLLLSDDERRQRFARLDFSYTSAYQPVYPQVEIEAHKQAAETVQRIADLHPDENIIFVTHASPVIGIVRHLTNTHEPIKVPLCSIFTLSRNGSGWQLVKGSDVSHLSDQEISLRYAHTG